MKSTAPPPSPRLAQALAMARALMQSDRTISGITLITADRGPTYFSRRDVLRKPKQGRADA